MPKEAKLASRKKKEEHGPAEINFYRVSYAVRSPDGEVVSSNIPHIVGDHATMTSVCGLKLFGWRSVEREQLHTLNVCTACQPA